MTTILQIKQRETGQTFIGHTYGDPKRYWYRLQYQLRNRKWVSAAFQAAWDKHPVGCWEVTVLEEIASVSQAELRERIDKYVDTIDDDLRLNGVLGRPAVVVGRPAVAVAAGQ